MESLIFLAVFILAILLLSYLAKQLFLRGRMDRDGYWVFNLSRTAEVSLILLYIAWAVGGFYGTITRNPAWYEWIIPVVFSLYLLGKAFSVYASRNNLFRLKGNTMEYAILDSNEHKTGVIEIDSYYFYQEQSDSLQFHRKQGWFLRLNGKQAEQEVTQTFDLDNLNMGNYRKALERAFHENEIRSDWRIKVEPSTS